MAPNPGSRLAPVVASPPGVVSSWAVTQPFPEFEECYLNQGLHPQPCEPQRGTRPGSDLLMKLSIALG